MKHNLADLRFGKLVVLSQTTNSRHGKTRWRCKCDCGNVRVVIGSVLSNGHQHSCGCLRREGRNKTHGKTGTRTYRVWSGMKARCFNPRVRSFKDYGARGITVCDRWRFSFQNFLADMGDPPPGTTLNRKNNNGSYEPANCVWSTPKEQMCNNRRTRLLTHDGITKNLSDWARFLGIHPVTLLDRLKTWPQEIALSVGRQHRYSDRSRNVRLPK